MMCPWLSTTYPCSHNHQVSVFVIQIWEHNTYRLLITFQQGVVFFLMQPPLGGVVWGSEGRDIGDGGGKSSRSSNVVQPIPFVPQHSALACSLRNSSIIYSRPRWPRLWSFVPCRGMHNPLHCQSSRAQSSSLLALPSVLHLCAAFVTQEDCVPKTGSHPYEVSCRAEACTTASALHTSLNLGRHLGSVPQHCDAQAQQWGTFATSARTQVTARLFTGAQQESSASCTSSQVKYRVII